MPTVGDYKTKVAAPDVEEGGVDAAGGGARPQP
jgi:hypothetical protein